MPKSVNFAPPSPSRMFAGFTSRWTIPAAWSAARAEATCVPMRPTSSAGTVVSARDGASSSSITRNGPASSVPTS